MPETQDVSVQVAPHGDKCVPMGKHWMRLHVVPRTRDYFPQLEDGGPDASLLAGTRISFTSYLVGHTETVSDDYLAALYQEGVGEWVGTTTFLTSTSSVSGEPLDLPGRDQRDPAGDDFMLSRPWDG
ncbi:MAG: hypothetical protein ACKPKO_34895, partial [Candidatus Fonsibacter sp.]